MGIKKEVIIGDCRLLLGDCIEIMPLLDKVDAVVTDPPYGIGIDGQKENKKGKKSDRKEFAFKGWDNATPPKEVFNLIFNISEHQIIWGANYFQDKIDKNGCGWLVWDKGQYGLTMSDGELAYTNFGKLRIFTKNRAVLAKDGTLHPTQKPLILMKWCIEQLPKETVTILDPFLGSGSTLVACAKMGRKGIGIEKDEDYFNIACKRVQEAYNSPDMFIEPPKKAPQEKFI